MILALALIAFALPAGAQSPVQWDVPWPQAGKPVQGYPILPGVETFEIYHATPETGMYSHHAQITWNQGTFFASWSNHPTGEDGPGQRVLGAISKDGRHWGKPFVCFPSLGPVKDPREPGRVLTAIALLHLGNRVYAIAEVDDRSGRGQHASQAATPEESTPQKPYLGRYGWGRIARSISTDGKLGPIFWLVDNPPKPIDGAPRLPSARDRRFRETARKLNAILAEPLHMAPWDFQHHTAWTHGEDGHLLCEPSVYRRPDGVLVKLSRDKSRPASYRLYASLSSDGGKHWTPGVQTNIPDSPSKATSGMLPDGRVYLIGNQVVGRKRDPLVLSLSKDGKTFDWAAAIRHDAPPVREGGSAKGPGFQYPSAVVADGALWVIYSIGKEDVAVSRVPLSSLKQGKQ